MHQLHQTHPIQLGTACRTQPGPARRRLLALAVAVLAALVAPFAPASAAQAASLPPRTALEVQIQSAVRTLLNSERAAHGLAPIAMNPALQLSARRHDSAMSRANALSHQLNGEPNFTSRMSTAGYNWSWAGENIGWSSLTTLGGVLQLQRMMYDERPPNDGHRRNILNPHFTDVGVDVYVDLRHGKVWLTTDFGRKR